MRIALSLMVGLGLVSAAYSQTPARPDKSALYASVGSELTHTSWTPGRRR